MCRELDLKCVGYFQNGIVLLSPRHRFARYGQVPSVSVVIKSDSWLTGPQILRLVWFPLLMKQFRH